MLPYPSVKYIYKAIYTNDIGMVVYLNISRLRILFFIIYSQIYRLTPKYKLLKKKFQMHCIFYTLNAAIVNIEENSINITTIAIPPKITEIRDKTNPAVLNELLQPRSFALFA